MHNLRLLREERKLSQQKLAVEFDIAQSQIQNYETGGYQPDIDTLNKYADFFDVSVDFLLGRTDIRRKPEAVKEYDLNTKEQELVDRYRSLRPNQRQSLALFFDTLEDK
ncbi:MAG TPA: XRE family transcriptional regulator [Lachnospiraceae bacterium]|nr:XRE family transcriptional regulator [Lachnospiraceae bacterium]